MHSKLGPWNCLIASKQMDLWSTSSGEFKTVLFCRLSRLQWSVLSNVTETGCIEWLTCGKSGQNSTCMLQLLHESDLSVKKEERRRLLFAPQDARCNQKYPTQSSQMSEHQSDSYFYSQLKKKPFSSNSKMKYCKR